LKKKKRQASDVALIHQQVETQLPRGFVAVRPSV